MRRLLVLSVLVLAIAGCGEKKVETDQVTRVIETEFAGQGVKLRDISCPDDIPAEKGARIRCTAVNPAGTKLFIEGEVTAVDGDQARFQVTAARGIAKGTVVAAEARKLLEREVGQRAAGMTCPAEVRIPTRPTVTCELTDRAGKRYDVTVAIDAASRMTARVASAPK